MTRFRLMLSLILALSAVAFLTAHAARPPAADSAGATPARSFEFTYQVHVPASADAASTHLWVPLPQPDAYQDIRNLQIDSPVSYKQGRDPEYGNAFAMFTPTPVQTASGFDVTMRFTATRREHKVSPDAATIQKVSDPAPRTPK